jgi:hypothetical protein
MPVLNDKDFKLGHYPAVCQLRHAELRSAGQPRAAVPT